jgi:hypothetical protein
MVRCRIGVHDERGSQPGTCHGQLMRTAGSSSFWKSDTPDRTDETDHALDVQSPRGDQAVELWLGAEMEQEANRKVRRAEGVIDPHITEAITVAHLAASAEYGRSAVSVPSDRSEFLTSTNLGERDFRIGALASHGGY